VVEDSPDDEALTRRAFRRASPDVEVVVQGDGPAALGWLGLALLVIAALALLVMLAREMRGVLRQRRIATLHEKIATARVQPAEPR
jgi:hypothetical protein